ncbi:MAG: cell division protein FtsA [Oceanicaulis sp.]|uniref:cell division protein FtsA n=1 Tax=Glycocaulis sp. TaxID=1969725 RepID=UPI0025B8BA4C|nr:cell division protein FtsA [Glycocaulis sp.]MCC5981453.1 cell division protein FtsA [Oceanicaulis sp.]MCH8522315.1 cell division protein FtsA [Glycocaulis sp.]
MGLFGLFSSSGNEAAGGKPGVFAALEVGAAKTVCFIVKTEATLTGTRPRVIGVSHQSSAGMRAGAVVDIDAAAGVIRTAVDNAERMAKQAVSSVSLVTTAGAPASTRVTVEAPVPGRQVSERDRNRVLAAGLQRCAEPGRAMLHAIPVSWRVDENRGVKDPRGMAGRTLAVDLHVISAAADPVRNLMNAVAQCRLEVSEVIAAPYAAGLSVLAEDEALLGATVIDMGADTTSVAVFADGVPVHVDVLPVGGAHVTRDIARGLTTPVHAAERIKSLYGSVLDSPDDDRAMIEAPPVSSDPDAGMNQHPRALLNAIIRPRAEEIFELVRDRLDAAGMSAVSGRTLVLTGGASQLPGLTELAGRILTRQARLGRPHLLAGLGDAMKGPGFAASTGVVARLGKAVPDILSGPPRFVSEQTPRRVARPAGERGPAAIWRWFAESF